MQLIRKLGITVIVLVLAYLLLRQLNLLPNINGWFKSKPVLIENTPLIVESIKDLKQIISISTLDEVVISKQYDQGGTLLGNIITNGPINPNVKRLGLIVKGSIYAGMDVALVNDSSISLYKDSISITLPPAKIITAIVNPSDTEVFIEQGSWDLLEINRAKAEARQMMIDRALNKKILEKAEFRGKLIIENFLRSIGFKKITVITTARVLQ